MWDSLMGIIWDRWGQYGIGLEICPQLSKWDSLLLLIDFNLIKKMIYDIVKLIWYRILILKAIPSFR